MSKIFPAVKPATVKITGKSGALCALSLSALFFGVANLIPLNNGTAFAQTTQPAQETTAQTDIISQPGVPILSFDIKNIGPILTEMKILWQERKAPDGLPFILANVEGDTVFVLSPLSCRTGGDADCLGLQLVSIFDDEDANPAAIADFNTRYAFANLNINNSGNAYLSRYDIADYGIARGNVASIIQTFIGLSRIYQNSFATKTQASNETNNGRTGKDNASIKIISYAPPDIQAGQEKKRLFEASANLKSLFEDGALPTNKIKNIGQ